MQYVGYIYTKKEITKSRNLWGDVSEISNIMLPVIEKNSYGDCLCYLSEKGLVDIDACDVNIFVPNPNKNPLDELMTMLQTLMKGES